MSKPDTIRIQLLFSEGANEAQLNRSVAEAERHAIEAAKVYGWQGWLKTEVGERKVTYRSGSDLLIR